jgi:hypothetical protein
MSEMFVLGPSMTYQRVSECSMQGVAVSWRHRTSYRLGLRTGLDFSPKAICQSLANLAQHARVACFSLTHVQASWNVCISAHMISLVLAEPHSRRHKLEEMNKMNTFAPSC